MAASLYRRHRPRTFADVVGQEHVVRTLSNALEQGRVHHAYLFVGSRGTGKTSMAKILAASLNCQNGGPTITPCGKCESCTAIASANSLDVIEMDAASNNSVDDIRDLRERVAYAPVAGGYKVYILDEAHMLTAAAWNAFLKTLEEPPPHTIFVLATTEANKVLPTVVDRCHRFDFGRPSVPQIAEVLRRVATSESIEIPDEAIALVARSATGSFRDALGTLEQLLSYSGSTIALEDVLAVLGAADADLIFGAVDAVTSGNAREALLAAARLSESGRDLGRFFGDLEAHARALMVVQVLGDVPPELSVTPEQDERLAEQAGRVGQAEVIRLLELLAASLRAMKDGADARTQLELALVKAATPELEPSVKALQARLARLESGTPARPAAKTPEVPQTAAGRATAPAHAAPAQGGHDGPLAEGGLSAPAHGGPAAPAHAGQGRPAAPPNGGSAAPVQGAPDAPQHTAPAHGGPAAPAQGAPDLPQHAGPARGGPAAPAQGAPDAPRHAAPAHGGPAAPAHVGQGGSAAPSNGGPAAPAQDTPDTPRHPAPAHGGSAAPAQGAPDAPRHPAPPAPKRPYGTPPPDAERGRTEVSITAQVEGQPPVAVSATLPGAGPGDARHAQEVADQAAASVAHELASEGEPAPAVSATVTMDPDGPAPAPSLELSLDAFGEQWPAVLESIRSETPMLAALLEEAAPAALDDAGLTLAWPESSAHIKGLAEDPTNRQRLANAIRLVTGSSLRLVYELRSDSEPLPVSAAATAAPVMSEDDLVKRFMDEFDAEELPPEPEEQT